jgi:hypothetical protein
MNTALSASWRIVSRQKKKKIIKGANSRIKDEPIRIYTIF